MKKLLAEPLLHFLAAGVALFIVFDVAGNNGNGDDSRVITVNQAALLEFLQYRSRGFEPELAAARLADMPETDLDRLIADYVREEALHREALALGMDANDYVIKRRLVQSMEFVTTEFVASTIDVAPEALEAYYEAHRDDYFIEPSITFTHVFFSSEKHGPDAARSLAQSKLETLNAQKTGFADSGGHGDRFAYSRNYVERHPQFVASHFGAGMADALFELTPDESTWQGPIASESGFHVVMLTRRETGRYPELREIEERVRDDARRDAISARQAQAIRSLVDTYEVRIDLDRGRGDAN